VSQTEEPPDFGLEGLIASHFHQFPFGSGIPALPGSKTEVTCFSDGPLVLVIFAGISTSSKSRRVIRGSPFSVGRGPRAGRLKHLNWPEDRDSPADRVALGMAAAVNLAFHIDFETRNSDHSGGQWKRHSFRQ